MKNKPLLFTLLLVFLLLFVSTCIYVFLSSNQLLKKLQSNVDIINVARLAADKTDNIQQDYSFYTSQGNSERIIELIEVTKPKSKKLNLVRLTELLEKLEKSAVTNVTGNNDGGIKQVLKAINAQCIFLVTQSRKAASFISEDLNKNWNLVIYLLSAACLIFILFVLNIYYGLSSKDKIIELKNIKSVLLDKSVDVVVSCDKQGRIVEFNPAAEEFFGYSKKEVVKKSISMLYADLAEARKVKESIHFNEIYRGDIRIRRKNGELFHAQLVANIVRNAQGEMIGSMGIARNESSGMMKSVVSKDMDIEMTA